MVRKTRESFSVTVASIKTWPALPWMARNPVNMDSFYLAPYWSISHWEALSSCLLEKNDLMRGTCPVCRHKTSIRGKIAACSLNEVRLFLLVQKPTWNGPFPLADNESQGGNIWAYCWREIINASLWWTRFHISWMVVKIDWNRSETSYPNSQGEGGVVEEHSLSETGKYGRATQPPTPS